jgi:hypothetical protein
MRAGKSIQELIAEFIAMDAIGLQAVLWQAKDRGVEFDLERSIRRLPPICSCRSRG